MRDKISFEPNVPIQVTLQYAEGKIVEGRFGQQVMYSLASNQIMYLDLAVAQKVNMLEPAIGESFLICKRWNGQKGSPVRWDVWLSPATEKLRVAKEEDPEPPSQLEEQLAASLHHVRKPPATCPAPAPQGTGTNGPVAIPRQRQAVPIKATYQSAMTEFLLIAGRATKTAEATLGAEGGSVRFDSRDVAALATTLLIQAAHDGIICWREGL